MFRGFAWLFGASLGAKLSTCASFEAMSGGVHGRNVPNAAFIGLVAGALLGVATGSGEAFLLGTIAVGTVALFVLDAKDED